MSLTQEQDDRLHELAALGRPMTAAELDELLAIMDDLAATDRRIETVRVAGDFL